MRLQSIFLSSAALLASATVGFAADLPTKKAAPVEYVRVCSAFGAGFFYVPGSDTCLKVSGRVRADYIYDEPLARSSNTVAFRGRGYIALDSYTATDWGPVRATTRLYTTVTSGTTSTNLDWAYIQFSGVTAGRIATSFFEFAPFGGVSLFGGGSNGRGSDYGAINALAYTFNAGNGFLATLSLEDNAERRVSGNTYAGTTTPDVVARLDWTQPWGQIALTGALHTVRPAYSFAGTTYSLDTATGAVVGKTSAGYAAQPDTEYGFAIQGGVKINLPMLAAGDALFLQAAYADGASSYTGWASSTVGNVATGGSDVTITAGGVVKKVQSWSLVGGIEHYWAPTVSTALFGSYGDYNAYLTANDVKVYGVGANVKWTPVKGLLVAGEGVYQKATDFAPFSATATSRQSDIWHARLRVQRDF